MSDRHALYYSNYCYFCLKVLMVLRDKDHQIELRDVSSGDHRQALIAGGGKGQVPCLLVESEGADDHWMYESGDIIHYIEQHGLALPG